MADNDSRKGFRYTDPELLAYVDRVHASHDAGLAAAFETPDGTDMPAIMVGPSEGRFLELLLRLIGARRVVEIGCLAGYSAIRMGRALPPDGHLWSIEYNPAFAETARKNIAAAGLADRVEVVTGAGLDVLPGLEGHGPFDVVFIDADKGNYDRYGAWAEQNLRPGGLLIGDNAYLFGNLLDESETAAAMRRFHERASEAFDSVCVPTPDGMLLGLKK